MRPVPKTHGTMWSAEVGAKICDFLTANPNFAAAARLVGSSSKQPKLVFVWMRNSANDERAGVPVDKSKWAIRDWPEQGDGPIYFHTAVIQARKIFGLIAESQVTSLLASTESGGGGHLRTVMDGGKVAFTVDPLVASHALEYSDDLWELTYGNRKREDVYARDENGALIPLTVRDPIPSQTLIHLIRSIFPEQFNPQDRKQIDARHQVEVLVLADQKPARQPSDMRADLEARLKEIRERGPQNRGIASVFGRDRPDDPKENVATFPADAPPERPRLAAPPSYAKPKGPRHAVN